MMSWFPLLALPLAKRTTALLMISPTGGNANSHRTPPAHPQDQNRWANGLLNLARLPLEHATLALPQGTRLPHRLSRFHLERKRATKIGEGTSRFCFPTAPSLSFRTTEGAVIWDAKFCPCCRRHSKHRSCVPARFRRLRAPAGRPAAGQSPAKLNPSLLAITVVVSATSQCVLVRHVSPCPWAVRAGHPVLLECIPKSSPARQLLECCLYGQFPPPAAFPRKIHAGLGQPAMARKCCPKRKKNFPALNFFGEADT